MLTKREGASSTCFFFFQLLFTLNLNSSLNSCTGKDFKANFYRKIDLCSR